MISLLWLLALDAAAAPSADDARVTQHQLPELQARAISARERAMAAEAYFSGTSPLEAAFPDLEGAPIGDPAWLAARLAQIRRRAVDRAAERVALPPGEPSRAVVARWRTQLQTTLDLEDRADSHEERLIAALAGLVERVPALSDVAIDARLDELARAREAMGPVVVDGRDEPARVDAVSASGAEQVAWLTLRSAARRTVTVPGDTTLASWVDARLDGAERNASTDASLRAVSPLLDPRRAEEVSALLSDRERRALEAELTTPTEAAPIPEGLTDVDLATRIAEMEAELAPTPEGPHPEGDDLESLRERVRRHRWSAAAATLESWKAALAERAEAAARGIALTNAEEAQRRAEEARLAAERQVGEIERALHSRIATLRASLAEVVTAEQTRRVEARAAQDALASRVSEQDDALSAALALPPLAPQRQETIDRVYASAWTIVSDVRTAEREAERGRTELLADQRVRTAEGRPTTDATASSPEMESILRDLDRSAVELDEALRARERASFADQQALARILQRAKAVRRRARLDASVAARQVIQQRFVEDLGREVAEAPMRLRLYATDVMAEVRAAPAALLDLSKVLGFLRASAGLLGLIALWWVGRGRARDLASWMASSLDASKDRPTPWARWVEPVWEHLVPGELDRSVERGAVVVRRGLDLVACAIVLPFLGADLKATVVALWLVVAWTAFRVVRPISKLLLVTGGEPGPALLRVERATVDRVERTAAMCLGWFFVWHVASVVSVAVLDADRIGDVVRLLRLASGVVLAVWSLAAWAPTIRVAVAREEPTERLVRWSVQTARGPAIPVAAAVGLGWLLARFAQDSLVPALSASRWFGWLDRALSNRDPSATAVEALSDDVRQVLDLPPPPPTVVAAVAFARRETASLSTGRTGGVIVLTSPGQRTREVLYTELAGTLGAEYGPVVRLPVPRLRDERAAATWLAHQLALPVADRLEDLAPALRNLPSSVLSLEELHHALLRSVGGYGIVRSLLRLAHESSDHHRWLVGVHRPTWDFLSRIPGAVDLHVVERVHHLERLSAAELGAWLRNVALAAGHALAMDPCADLDADLSDRERHRRLVRAERSVWREIEHASDGEPHVAHAAWLARLGVDPARARMLLVEPIVAASAPDTRSLDDPSLFTLQSLVLHEELDVPDLARSLQLDEPQIATLIRALIAAGTVRPTDGGYRVAESWSAAVHARLHRRHLLHATSRP
ncbi:MAG: hypothetical protein KC621_05180 [Myxococcales bacterium]|nr:hypothetical protein [Myxococcales bacterium]